MIAEEYILGLKEFTITEVNLTKQYAGEEAYQRAKPYYEEMYNYVSQNPTEFIPFDKSNVTFYEFEFADAVEEIKHKLIELCDLNNIPREVVFIYRYKIKEGFWDSIIHKKVADLIRYIFDLENGEDFQTLRQFKAFDRNQEIDKWIKSKNGKNFLFEFQVSEGLRKELLVKKRLYLFDDKFVYVQMQYLSRMFWVHNIVIEASEKWKKDKTLWKNIDHLKRRIENREILDESRLEINFMRLMERNGLKGKFIHDEAIDWNIKYRPDFWFVTANLIVEYDEKAHGIQIELDLIRENIIKKYLPNVHFIRVKEGNEQNGLNEILEFLEKFERE